MSEITDLVREVLAGHVEPETHLTHVLCKDGWLLHAIGRGLPFGIDPFGNRTVSITIPISHSPVSSEEVWIRPYAILIVNPLDVLNLKSPDQKIIVDKMKSAPYLLVYQDGPYTMGHSIFDSLHLLGLDFPNDRLHVKRVLCTNNSEVVLICQRTLV